MAPDIKKGSKEGIFFKDGFSVLSWRPFGGFSCVSESTEALKALEYPNQGVKAQTYECHLGPFFNRTWRQITNRKVGTASSVAF